MFLQIFSAAPFPRLRVPLPLVSSEVCAGFPSPADHHLEGVFDLNELLVRMGAPEFQWRDRFEEWGVEVFSSDYALYGDMSRRVMEILAGFTSAIEVYSIDEAFLEVEDWTGGQLQALGAELRERVLRWTGLPVGVGVAATKTLAKVANRQAKRTGGVCVLDRTTLEGQALLEAWPVAELWGVAGGLQRRLAELGIRTAGQLARAKPMLLRQKFGVVTERMALELQGVSCLALEAVAPPRQNLCCSRSFGRPVENFEELREAVATHATRAGEKLRRQKSAASAIQVFLHTNRHRPERPQYFPAAGHELLVPTAFTPELIGETVRVLERIYREGHQYTKAGILCLGLVPDEERQESLSAPWTGKPWPSRNGSWRQPTSSTCGTGAARCARPRWVSASPGRCARDGSRRVTPRGSRTCRPLTCSRDQIARSPAGRKAAKTAWRVNEIGLAAATRRVLQFLPP